MKVIIPPGSSGDIVATIAIGEPCLNAWTEYALPTWARYCNRHGLGLVVFDQDMVPKESKTWKKATWQKLLIGETLTKELPAVRNVCYLDTDILINYTAPNVFRSYDASTIGLVSLHRNLPYPRDHALRRMAFLRRTYYDPSYPLDSVVFVTLERLYGYHGLPPQKDEACMGFIVFNVENHSRMMREWFDKYDRDVTSITGGGDQTHLNYEIQNWGRVTWFEYRWQAMWAYEMPWKYPFLYAVGSANQELVRQCIEGSLFANYFLHFAGSWHESEMWKTAGVLESPEQESLFEAFSGYEKVPLTGEPVGAVKPKHKTTGS